MNLKPKILEMRVIILCKILEKERKKYSIIYSSCLRLERIQMKVKETKINKITVDWQMLR